MNQSGIVLYSILRGKFWERCGKAKKRRTVGSQCEVRSMRILGGLNCDTTDFARAAKLGSSSLGVLWS